MLNFKRPLIMLIERKWIWLAGFVCIVLVFGILASWAIRPKSYVYSAGKPGMPAEAAVKTPSFEFQVGTDQANASGENYFVNYRLKREQVRQETKAMLVELLNAAVVKNRQQAQEEWLALSTKQQQEEEIENLLKIKGFQDAVADVFPGNVTVIIYAPGLSQNEISLIQDVVIRVTNVRLDKITISAKK